MTEAPKARKKKKRRKKNYLLRLLVLIAIGVGMYFLLSSSFFDVQQVAVENNDHYTKEQIIAKAGAKTGPNIFAMDTDAIKEKLLKDPYIKHARVKRSLPGKIVIRVEERKEAAAIPYSTRFIIVDADGMVLRKSDVEPKLPVLVGMTIKTMEDGQPLEVEETSVLTGALGILSAMENTQLYFKKIDISNVVVKAYIYDQLVCKGVPDNVLESMSNGNLKRVLVDLYTNGIERGIINVGSDNYYSFSPMIE